MAELVSGDALDDVMAELDGWTLSSDGIALEKTSHSRASTRRSGS